MLRHWDTARALPGHATGFDPAESPLGPILGEPFPAGEASG